MHIYFSGIGGAGLAPLALIAKEAGFEVSGSDKQNSSYIEFLQEKGLKNIRIGQSREEIAKVHDKNPIDWFVYSSALPLEDPKHPELEFCKAQKIKLSKRDELLNQILKDKNLKLIAIAGTHGKTTTTAMAVWLFEKLNLPVSYLLPAKTSYAEMGRYDKESEYFVYECDEFDRNFLAFNPYVSLISGVSWDHHEIFKTREDYLAAFREFISQSGRTVLWQDDFEYLNIETPANLLIQDASNVLIDFIKLPGRYTRLDAWLAIAAVHRLTKKPLAELIKHMNDFPGLQRRMEQIIPNLYSDYAHTPDKIRGAMSVALEMAATKNQNVVVVYEPLTNRRQHYMMDDYKDCFNGAAKVYWVPSYLAREDPKQRVIPPSELISHLSDPSIAEPVERGANLKKEIQKYLDTGDMVVCMAGGGGDSLDDWIRQEFKK